MNTDRDPGDEAQGRPGAHPRDGALPPPTVAPPSRRADPGPAPTAPETRRRRPRRNLLNLGGIMVVVGAMVGVVGGVALAAWGVRAYMRGQPDQTYATGHAAYVRGDCVDAVGPLRDAVTRTSPSDGVGSRARAELRECEQALSALDVEARDDLAGAVLVYVDFLDTYPASSVAEDLRSRAAHLVASAPPDRIAAVAVCRRIRTIEQLGLVAAPASTLPPLLLECGQTYEHHGLFVEALAMYRRFVAEYPDHVLRADVDAGYAHASAAVDADGP